MASGGVGFTAAVRGHADNRSGASQHGQGERRRDPAPQRDRAHGADRGPQPERGDPASAADFLGGGRADLRDLPVDDSIDLNSRNAGKLGQIRLRQA